MFKILIVNKYQFENATNISLAIFKMLIILIKIFRRLKFPWKIGGVLKFVNINMPLLLKATGVTEQANTSGLSNRHISC